ncbi:MAG: DUF4976 domain-containing protein, partial [Opitutales bacterium]
LRGMKRTLTEGGIRMPTIAWQPDTVEKGSQCDQPFYFGDLMATTCEMTGTPLPQNTDSVSFLPTLKGQPTKQSSHKYLYWEFYERIFRQAVVKNEWKLIRSGMDNSQVELYDLNKDIHEDKNLAKTHPALVQRLISHMEEAHVPHPNWKASQSQKK